MRILTENKYGDISIAAIFPLFIALLCVSWAAKWVADNCQHSDGAKGK